jgi:hypothetical protein
MWVSGNTFRPAGTVTPVGIACFYQHIVPMGQIPNRYMLKIFYPLMCLVINPPFAQQKRRATTLDCPYIIMDSTLSGLRRRQV